MPKQKRKKPQSPDLLPLPLYLSTKAVTGQPKIAILIDSYTRQVKGFSIDLLPSSGDTKPDPP